MNDQQRQNTIDLLNTLIFQAAGFNDLMGLNGVKIEIELHNDHIDVLKSEGSGFSVITSSNGEIYVEKMFVKVVINKWL